MQTYLGAKTSEPTESSDYDKVFKRAEQIIHIHANFIGLTEDPPVESMTSKRRFWNEFRQARRLDGIGFRAIDEFSEKLTDDDYERMLRKRFGHEIRTKIADHLNSSIPTSLKEMGAGVGIHKIMIKVMNINYGNSIDFDIVISGIKSVMDKVGLSPEDIVGIVELYTPEALSACLGGGVPFRQWDVDVDNVITTFPAAAESIQSAEVTAEAPRALEKFKLNYDSSLFWKLVNAMWALPIGIALLLSYVAYRDSWERTTALDNKLAEFQQAYAKQLADAAAKYTGLPGEVSAIYEKATRIYVDVIEKLVQRPEGGGVSQCCICAQPRPPASTAHPPPKPSDRNCKR